MPGLTILTACYPKGVLRPNRAWTGARFGRRAASDVAETQRAATPTVPKGSKSRPRLTNPDRGQPGTDTFSPVMVSPVVPGLSLVKNDLPGTEKVRFSGRFLRFQVVVPSVPSDLLLYSITYSISGNLPWGRGETEKKHVSGNEPCTLPGTLRPLRTPLGLAAINKGANEPRSIVRTCTSTPPSKAGI